MNIYNTGGQRRRSKSLTFRLSLEVSGRWFKYQNLLTLRLCPLDKGSDGSPGWQDALPAGLYRVLSRSVLKTAHSFCLTAQIVMWIWFQCYAHIALPFKMKYLHLLELGMFYNHYVRTLLFVEPLFPWWMQCVYSKVPVTFVLILWGCVISRSFVVFSWGHDI